MILTNEERERVYLILSALPDRFPGYENHYSAFGSTYTLDRGGVGIRTYSRVDSVRLDAPGVYLKIGTFRIAAAGTGIGPPIGGQ